MKSPYDRRVFLHDCSVSTFLAVNSMMLLLPSITNAVGEGSERMVFRQKPTVPTGALLPAIQQRLLLEAALNLAKKGNIESKEKLKTILMPLSEEDSINASKNQDVKILKQYDPAKVLRGDLTRACMNLYQTNLNYDSILSNINNPTQAYEITDPEWKKSYIRSKGGLPDIKKVIGADLDMRQLLRNQVQLKLDDASAELYAIDYELQELIALLEEACKSFDLWLDRVNEQNLQDAIQAAMKGETIQIYESYTAGFLPPKQQ